MSRVCYLRCTRDTSSLGTHLCCHSCPSHLSHALPQVVGGCTSVVTTHMYVTYLLHTCPLHTCCTALFIACVCYTCYPVAVGSRPYGDLWSRSCTRQCQCCCFKWSSFCIQGTYVFLGDIGRTGHSAHGPQPAAPTPRWAARELGPGAPPRPRSAGRAGPGLTSGLGPWGFAFRELTRGGCVEAAGQGLSPTRQALRAGLHGPCVCVWACIRGVSAHVCSIHGCGHTGVCSHVYT